MAEGQLMGYGQNFTSDNDASLKSKSGGVFGLNQKARLIKFGYNSNVAKEGEDAREAIEIVVQVGEREYLDWINPITKVYSSKNNNELTDKSSPEYIDEYNKLMNQQGGLMTHYLKSVGVTEDAIKHAYESGINSFAEWGQKMSALLPADYSSKPLDVFLEYQYEIKTGQDRTFLTLPRNMKGGYFIVPAQAGEWKPDYAADGAMRYINEQGAEHPFTRNANFMSSNKAKQQGAGAPAANNGAGQPNAGMTPGNGEAKKSTWK